MNNIIIDKTIGAFEARRRFGNLLREVEMKGDRFIVERHGEAVAAVVPMEVYNQWKKTREAFFSKIREVANRVNLAPLEAETIADKAVKSVRSTS